MTTQAITVDPSQVQSISVDPSQVSAMSRQSSPTPVADPSTLHKVWNWANKGLISGKTLLNVVGDLTPGKPPDMKPGESTSDYLTRVQDKVDPNHPYWNALKVGLAGVDKDVADTISGFTSPLGLGTIAAGGAGELPGAAGKAARSATTLASTGFAAKGAGDVYDAATDNAKDLPTRVQQGLQGAATMAGGVAGAAESASQITPAEATAPVRAVTRATNKVLQKAPSAAGAAVGAAAGGAVGGGWGATAGAEIGRNLGREYLPKVQLPENIGLPKRVTGGPAVAPPYQPPVSAVEDFREPGTSPQTESAATSEEQEPPETSTPAPAPKPDTSPAAIQAKLNDALGGKPLQKNVPLKNQVSAKTASSATSNLPEGFTPVDSSAIKGYKYDPQAQELTTISTNGQQYTHAEVSPDDFKAFQDADSKGKAWNTIRQNHVLTQKNGRSTIPSGPRTVVTDLETGAPEFSDVVAARKNGGQTTAATPAKAPAADEDLTNLLQQSLDQVKGKQQTTKTDLGQLAVTPQGKGAVIPPGGVMTSAAPADLAKRWGVDESSLADTDRNVRGLNEQQSQAYINKLADSYKNGRPVEPVMETRDANNNIISVDGRHRAIAAQKAGIERIPIIVRRIGTVQ